MILGILSVLVTLSPAPDSFEVRGRVPDNPYVLASVPALRTGTYAESGGVFRLRLPRVTGCQELLVSYTNLRTVIRFQAPVQGSRVDLGDVRLPRREPRAFRIGAEPILSDTVGTCVPKGGPWPETWPSAEATVSGIITRNGRPLRQAEFWINCGNYISGLTRTDSAGAYAIVIQASFPHDLRLVEGRASCLLRTSTQFDPPVPFDLQFVRTGQPPSAASVIVALPGPAFRVGDTVAASGDYNSVMPRFRDAVAFRAGPLTGSEFVRMAIVNRPARPVVYRRGVCGLPKGGGPVSMENCNLRLELPDTLAASELLPLAILVSTGRQQPLGGRVLLNLPDEYVRRISSTVQVNAYYRLAHRYVADSAVFLPLTADFMPSTQLVNIDLVGAQFDAARSSRGDYEALIVLRIGPPHIP